MNIALSLFRLVFMLFYFIIVLFCFCLEAQGPNPTWFFLQAHHQPIFSPNPNPVRRPNGCLSSFFPRQSPSHGSLAWLPPCNSMQPDSCTEDPNFKLHEMASHQELLQLYVRLWTAWDNVLSRKILAFEELPAPSPWAACMVVVLPGKHGYRAAESHSLRKCGFCNINQETGPLLHNPNCKPRRKDECAKERWSEIRWKSKATFDNGMI